MDIRTVSDAVVAVHIPCGAVLCGARRRLTFVRPRSRGQVRLLRELSKGLREVAESVENVLLVDESAVAGHVGGIRAAQSYRFAADDVPTGYAHPTVLGSALGRHYEELMADHQLLGHAKALLVDFDNTLWQGVMAEGNVIHDTHAQQLLRQLKNAGILLVALSKNSEASIRWDEMALAQDDFVLRKINWLPKPDNVAAAVKELGLAAEAFVLLDDNPAERALVTGMIPGVRALDPAAPGAWRALRRWLAFPSTRQTDEARRRTVMYREAAERRAAMSAPRDYETTMKSLGLRYAVRLAAVSDLPRATELIERTNQFNTTTRRWTPAEVRALLEAPSTSVHVATLKDRFGDLGVVAVAVFDRAERAFDAVIMSCRAMGFGLEFALLGAVMEAAGPGSFTGRFVPTDRNGPAARLFEQAGFRRVDEETSVLPPGSAGPQAPSWLTRG
jgi:FkbH-like protein